SDFLVHSTKTFVDILRMASYKWAGSCQTGAPPRRARWGRDKWSARRGVVTGSVVVRPALHRGGLIGIYTFCFSGSLLPRLCGGEGLGMRGSFSRATRI